MYLNNKKILLGISGGIAAYKTATLVREFVKKGAFVKIILTPAACNFVTPLTLSTLSKNKVLIDFFDSQNGEWNSHVDLSLWADVMIIAPATANTIAKMVHGIADNLLLTTYLSARCPVFVAPTMDLDMYQHPATSHNIDVLKSYGHNIIEATTGELASGLQGKGRMQEPEIIAQIIENYFSYQPPKHNTLYDKKIVITAGPTYENIDPVRFIGNYSSGKMGFAIAKEMANRGAYITLVSGPTSLEIQHPNITRINVRSADQMYKATLKAFQNADCAIMAAAVADYTPANPNNDKIKRQDGTYSIELKATKDIAAELGKIKTDKQLLIGFALETQNEEQNAKLKLDKKNLDIIILNSLNDKGAGFQTDTNKITIIDRYNNIQKYDLKTKHEVAKDIADKITEMFLSK